SKYTRKATVKTVLQKIEEIVNADSGVLIRFTPEEKDSTLIIKSRNRFVFKYCWLMQRWMLSSFAASSVSIGMGFSCSLQKICICIHSAHSFQPACSQDSRKIS